MKEQDWLKSSTIIYIDTIWKSKREIWQGNNICFSSNQSVRSNYFERVTTCIKIKDLWLIDCNNKKKIKRNDKNDKGEKERTGLDVILF